MNQDNHISFDSALRTLMVQPPPQEGGDYAVFLEKLSEHETATVALDDLLKEKLRSGTTVPQSVYRSIIASLWISRIKKAGIIVLLLTGFIISLDFAVDYFSEQHHTDNASEPYRSIPSDVEVMSPKNQSLTRHPANHEVVKENVQPTADKNFKSTIQKTSLFQTPPLITGMNSASPRGFTSMILKSRTFSFAAVYNHNDDDVLLMIPLPLISEGTISLPKTNGFVWSPNFEIGLSLLTSIQHYQSDIMDNDPENTNRNYASLTQNGQQSGQVLNFGISLEKPIFKQWGVSLGLQKYTLEQKQRTNYILTEAPVYDLDGRIAGYIDIIPEKIDATIANKIHYIALPINLLFTQKLHRGYGLQLKTGSSLMGMVEQHTQKFNYKTLDLGEYNRRGQRISMNNAMLGLSCSRSLPGRFTMAAGYEIQWLKNISQLSDPTEKVSSNIQSFTLSLKYQY